jgi:hypothetical protein
LSNDKEFDNFNRGKTIVLSIVEAFKTINNCNNVNITENSIDKNISIDENEQKSIKGSVVIVDSVDYVKTANLDSGDLHSHCAVVLVLLYLSLLYNFAVIQRICHIHLYSNILIRLKNLFKKSNKILRYLLF